MGRPSIRCTPSASQNAASMRLVPTIAGKSTSAVVCRLISSISVRVKPLAQPDASVQLKFLGAPLRGKHRDDHQLRPRRANCGCSHCGSLATAEDLILAAEVVVRVERLVGRRASRPMCGSKWAPTK